MIPDYEQRLDMLLTGAFPHGGPALDDWVHTKFELQELRNNDFEISVVIDMVGRDIIEYRGLYDHASVVALLDNIEAMLEDIEDDIDKDADAIDCNLVWERDDPDDVATTYLAIEYVGKHVYMDENGESL